MLLIHCTILMIKIMFSHMNSRIFKKVETWNNSDRTLIKLTWQDVETVGKKISEPFEFCVDVPSRTDFR